MEGVRPERRKTTFLYAVALIERMRRQARRHKRSLNSEMEFALELYCDEQEREEQERDRARDHNT